MKKHTLLGTAAALAITVATSPALADMEAAQQFLDNEIGELSSLSREDQEAEMQWFIDAAQEFQGMDIRVVSETIATHEYESKTLAKAFSDITGINVTHDLIGEGDVVEKLQTQMQSGENIYDAYVNDSGSDVNAILFDEPLTVIDPHMKWQLRSELKQLHREFEMTMVYVTHDQTEALTFADKVVVMYDGEVVQTGTPEELFERPQHTFVGYFIGSPGMNVLPCKVDGGLATVAGARIALPRYDDRANLSKTELGIRPEFVRIVERGQGHPIQIDKIEDIGSERIVRARLGDLPLSAVLAEGDTVPSEAAVTFDPHALNLYDNSRLVARSEGNA